MLNASEESAIKQALNNETVVSTQCARLYKGSGAAWQYTDKWGGIALTKSGASHYLKLIDLNSNAVIFTQELYEGFEYQNSKAFFHVFEGDDAVYGLSFAEGSNASAFHSKVSNAAPGSSGSSASTRTPPTRGPPPSTPSRGPPPTTPSVSSPPPTSMTASSDDSFSSSKDSNNNNNNNNNDAPKPAAEKAKKKRFGGFTLRGLKNKITGEDAGADVEISKPRDFRHMSSIGWTPENGFEIRNIPPEWRKLFQQAGVKKSELKDAETAAFVMDIIQQEGGLEMLASEQQAADAADTSPAAAAAPTKSAPTPPAPPTPPSAPTPPPAPASRPLAASGGGAPRGGLLDQIKQGKELKKAETKEAAPPPSAGLADTLAKAMEARRGNMNVASKKRSVLEDDDSDSDWD